MTARFPKNQRNTRGHRLRLQLIAARRESVGILYSLAVSQPPAVDAATKRVASG